MSIISALIAKHPDVVLCEHSDFMGNFRQITRMILQKVILNKKYTIDYEKYNFHYINENKITYLCLCEGVEKLTAFSFLEDFKKKILNTYKIEELLTFKEYQLNAFTVELKGLIVILIINNFI